VDGRVAVSVSYPVFMRLSGRRCVVVGGGVVAERKVRALIDADAEVVVVAPSVIPALPMLESRGELVIRRRDYQAGDLEGALLVFAATNDRAVNARVAVDARAAGALVNSVDSPQSCDFTVPATARRGEVTVAVSTGGRSPAFARQLREEIEAWLTPERTELLELLAGVRAEIMAAGVNPTGQVWSEAIDQSVIGALHDGDREIARQRLRARLVSPPADLHV
jgi:precorrin-2 dehydrogenase / sirohydrochlorin ferrochelatase